jgi:hypothetical protein
MFGDGMVMKTADAIAAVMEMAGKSKGGAAVEMIGNKRTIASQTGKDQDED